MGATDATQPPSVTAAVLAGGAANRLGGRDKGLVFWRGRELVRSVLDILATQVDELLIVANRHLDVYARFARVVSDKNAGFRGPLEGIATALRAAHSARVLVVPVDCPEPPLDLVRRLAHASDAGFLAAVAHDGQRRQPLFGLYDRSMLHSAEQAAQADWPVWRWQDSISACEVDFQDCAIRFRNLNVPADFESASDANHD